jgi:hypothetical protein
MLLRMLMAGISSAALIAGAASAQTNTSTFSQTGVGNTATVDNAVAGNIGNSSTIIQNGTANSATVYQRQTFNRSFIQQIGTSNTATHFQVGDANGADSRQFGDFQHGAVTQAGTSNSATVEQSGFYNQSRVRQGYAIEAGLPDGGEARPTSSNQASVNQNGAGLISIVNQRAASTSAPPASNNVANVLQRSSGSASQAQQTSQIDQISRGNYAELFQYEGSTVAPNVSRITQRDSTADSSNPRSDNWTSVAQQGQGHESDVVQDGRRNSATVRTQGGGIGTNAGNASSIAQSGTDLRAATHVQRRAAGQALSNRTTISQAGAHHGADTYQFGVGGLSAIVQGNGVDTGSYANGGQARALAFVSQSGASFESSITQIGDNYGEVVQGFGSTSRTSLNQVDAGDINGTRSFNSAIVSQYGDRNIVGLLQDSVGATATAWQRLGSADNSIEIAQGAGRTAQAPTAGTPGFTAGSTGSATTALIGHVVQGGAWNAAVLHQDGSQLEANITQNGTANSALPNRVFVSQTGALNRATVLQGIGVGPSAEGDAASGHNAGQNAAIGEPAVADEYYFPGGARSAEARILQTSTGNVASIEQYGRGQFAIIEQSGGANVASILQQTTATNATAIIRQQGSGNSYSIDQSTAGQYILVTQTGTANSAQNVVTRP